MNTIFYETVKNIFRLKIPFDRVYTSVFLIITDNGDVLVDCATTKEDVDGYIVPALNELGHPLTSIKTLVLTHSHEDHAGGASRISELAPSIKVVTQERILTTGVSTYALPGHTDDFIGVLDERTSTLISGDGLQGAGVDKYRCYTQNPEAYLESLEKIKSDERIENVLFSHEYEPWYTDHIFGRENVCKCLLQCKEYIKR